MSDLPSWMASFVAFPRPLFAQRTLFTILLSCSALRLDTLTPEELNTKISSTSSWGSETPASVLARTARKRKPDFAEQLEAVAEAGTSEKNLSNVSHDVFEDEEMEFVPEAPELHRLISTEEEMYEKWPKLVTSVLSLRTQLVAFSAIKANSDAGVADLLSGLDDKKLAILKGLIGASPHSDSVVAELGVDVFSVLDGLAGAVYKSRSLVNQSLKEMEIQLATSATRVEGLPVKIEKVESTDTQVSPANQTLVSKSTLKKAALECDQVSAVILLSFADDHPSMVGRSHLVTDTSVLLPKVKMFSDWYLEGAIGKSVYSRWKLGADQLSKNLHQTLNRTWRKPIQADLRSVAQEFLVRTSAFIDNLNTFVKEFRSELMLERNGADATEAWSLLSTMLSAIFKTMSDARDEAGDKPEDVTDLTLRAARVLWGTWQCH
jgi:hypothetical protein